MKNKPIGAPIMPARSYYVETSVWGMLASDSPALWRRFSQRFLRNARVLYISDVVLNEITKAPESTRSRLVDELKVRRPTILSVTDECRKLAEAYAARGIIPEGRMDDALHIATATIHRVDIAVSWNNRQLANLRRRELYLAINLLEGYWRTPLIVTPIMVLDG